MIWYNIISLNALRRHIVFKVLHDFAPLLVSPYVLNW